MRIAIIIDAVVIGGAEWQSVLSAAELTRRGMPATPDPVWAVWILKEP